MNNTKDLIKMYLFTFLSFNIPIYFLSKFNHIRTNPKELLSKAIFNCSALLVALFVFSCSPQSKESYLKDYKEFISIVIDENMNYTEKEWAEMDKKHEKFTGEWYSKFKNDFTYQELIVLKKYDFQYNFTKVKKKSSTFINSFLKEDYNLLKEKIKYYKENNMNEELDLLIKQADSVGKSATKMVEDVLDELNKEN